MKSYVKTTKLLPFLFPRKKIIKQKSGDKSQKNMVSDKEKDQ